MKALLKQWLQPYKKRSGLSLVEILLAMALMGFVSMSIANFMIKSNVTSTSISARFKEANEVHALIDDIRQDLLKGAYIAPTSYDKRLEYTVPDSSGNAVKKIYRIITESSRYHLQLSTDGGSTWISPYRISAYNKYDVGSFAKFLYAGLDNSCSDFIDYSSADSVWDYRDWSDCMDKDAWNIMYTPTEATKVDLRNFRFTTGTGSPTANRFMPLSSNGDEWDYNTMSWVVMESSDIYLQVKPALVRSNVVPASPMAKDPQALQSFATNTANSMYGTAFDVRGVSWDQARRRLVVVGRHSSGANRIFLADRNGVLIGDKLGLVTSDPAIQLDSVAIEDTSKVILALDAAAKKIYRFNVDAPLPLSPLSTLNLATPSNLVNSPTGIAFDPATPDDVYIVGTDPSTSGLKIWERNKISGTLVGTAWSLPAAFDASNPPSGLAIEPLSGDFLVVRNSVNGTSPNQTIDIYRIKRSDGTTTSFSINVSDLTNTATGTTGNWGLAYDPMTNRFFLSDSATDEVSEIIADRIITSRS